MLLWTLPWFRTETRAASFALLGAMAYLTYFPPAVFPWYLCLPSLLAFLTLSGAVARGLAALPHFSRVVTQRVGKGIIVGLVAASIATNGWLLVQVARQVKAQQYLIEDRNRQQIGLWLRETASPTDTVMLEPLGYIGYFSRLKTYDVPGLSSREVVEAIQRVGINWDNLINELEPTWLVLRDSEIQSIDKSDSKILGEHYEMQRVFDVAPLVQAVNCYGTYLEFDSRFTVYRLRGHL